MTDPVPVPPVKQRSWGRVALVTALVLSLALNALAAGAWLRFREVRNDLLGPEATAARLPDDLRQDLRRALRAEARTFRPLLRDLVAARAAIVSAAEARPFIRADAEAAMTDFRAALDALLAEVQQAFLDQLEAKAREN